MGGASLGSVIPGLGTGLGALGGGLLGALGGKGEDGPAAPDFAAAARAQADSGRINQSNPFGSTSWSIGPDGRPTQNTQLMGQIGSQGPIGTGDQAREQAIAAGYNSAASRLDPQWSQREEAMRARLAAQGLDPGTQAADAEIGNFNQARTDAYGQALMDAIKGGTLAQTATFNQNLASANAPYQQLGMIQNLLSGLSGQGPQTPFLAAAGQQYQGAQNQYATDQAGKNSMFGGMASLAPLLLKK